MKALVLTVASPGFSVQKELDILGLRNALPEDFRAVIHLLEKKEFPVNQAVSLVVPLEEAAVACGLGAKIRRASRRSWSLWIDRPKMRTLLERAA